MFFQYPSDSIYNSLVHKISDFNSPKMIRFIIRTSLVAFLITYSLNWWYFVSGNGSDVISTDCSVYAAGKGLNKDGKPFQVN